MGHLVAAGIPARIGCLIARVQETIEKRAIMTALMVNDPVIAGKLIAERKALQTDRFDEIWEGVYMMSAMANNEHQRLATELSIAIGTAVDWRGLGNTFTGANVSNQRSEWAKNYRIPDVLVFAHDTSAEDCDTHWFGGPEFAIEVVSPGDRTLEKLGFYADVGTRELLVIDRDPWRLTLYRVDDQTMPGQPKKLRPAAIDTAIDAKTPSARITLQTFPLSFLLSMSQSAIEVSHASGELIRSIPIQVRPGSNGPSSNGPSSDDLGEMEI